MKKLLLIILLFVGQFARAQTTIATNYVSNSPYYFNAGAGYQTFSIQNTNAYPVLLTGIEIFQLPVYSNNSYKVSYSSTSLSGPPGLIASPTWTLVADSSKPITTSTQTNVSPFKCINFPIPANTTYRFVVEATSGFMFRSNTAPYSTTPNIFSASGVNLLLGDYLNGGVPVGRAGITNLGLIYTNPSFFFGSITIAPANTYTDLYISNVTKPGTICGQTNSLMTATLCNRSTQAIDFSVNNTTVNFTLNGPNGPQNQSFLINTGTLAPCNCSSPTVIGMNYSAAGTYTLTATASISGATDVNLADNTYTDSISNFKITPNKTIDSICQNSPPVFFNPFLGSGCLPKTGKVVINLTTNNIVPVDGSSDATCGLNFANGTLPTLPNGAVITGGKFLIKNLRNTSPSKANEPRFTIYGASPNGPSSPCVPGISGNQNAFTFYRFDYETDLMASQLNSMYTALGAGGSFQVGYWESLDDLVGTADIQLNAQLYATATQLTIDYTIMPESRWYSNPTGGPLLATGSSFNPFFVTGGIANTATPGTTTFYAACSGDTVCRVPVSVLIKPSPTVIQDSIYACELISSTGNSIFDLTTVDANVSNNLPGASVNYFLDNTLTSPVPTPTQFNTSSTVVYSKVEVPGGCASSDSVLLFVNPKPDFTTQVFTGFSCAPGSIDVSSLLNPFSTIPPGTDTFYFSDPLMTIPYPNPFSVNIADTIYMLFSTNTSPACADTAEAYINIVPLSGYIASQDIGFNVSIAGNVGCNNIFYTDGMVDTIKTSSDCRRIATITDVSNLTSLGNVSACEDIASSTPYHNLQPYVNRTYQITAAISDTANVCLYYLNDDFEQYNADAVFNGWPLLPTAATMPANMGNIAITKVDNGDLNAPGHIATAIPSGSISANYNPSTTVWEICFPVSGFSYFYLHTINPGNVPLPVSLLSFTGKSIEGKSNLQWSTSTEQNNSHFIVERSRDGLSFNSISSNIASKAMNGNSQEKLDYAYVDNTPFPGHNYYKVRQVDIDGRISYSQVVDVYFGNETLVTFYPNPVTSNLNIDVNTPNATHSQVKITDATGRIVKIIEVQLQSGNNTIQVDMQHLADGMYMVQITNNKGLNYTQPIRKN